MKNCCRKCCCACCRRNVMEELNNDTILLPKNEATKQELETDRLYIFGSVPPDLKSVLMEGFAPQEHNPVVKIVCGKYHCIILLTQNRLYGFGLNDMGQLGLPFETKEATHLTQLNINIPEINLNNFQILDIAAGDEFSLILIQTQDNQKKIINFWSDLINKYIQVENPPTQKVEKIPDEVNINNINQIIAYEKRKIFCTENNEIFLGGQDFSGMELEGYGLLKKFEKKIKNIFLQKESCIVQDDDDDIWGLSDNSYKEFGFESGLRNEFQLFKYIFKEEKGQIKQIKQIKKISVGARHLLILLETGELFSMGDNSDGQCCGNSSTYSYPNLVEMNNKNKIIDCYAGYNHNLIILENGCVYTWGNTENGKLGYFEDNISQETPKEVLSMKIRCINHVCLGKKISIIVTGRNEDSIVFKYRADQGPEIIDP